MHEIRAFKEDMAPQMILLMGLPAAGKSTFVKEQLTKYYQHRMPHVSGFKVINSDVQLRRFQYEKAVQDFQALQQVDNEDEWAKQTASMSYRSNDGANIDFVLKHDEFAQMKGVDDFWRKMYKPYYATYFGERSAAKKSTDELADEKIGKGDVVIIDSTGVNTSKMLSYFKTGHAKGYTTSVVWLEIDPDYSVARDAYRGETEGRSVGEQVLRSYVPKIAAAWKTYLAENELVDRLLHFRWHGEVVKGTYKQVRDLKRYPRKEKKEKMAASLDMKRLAIASLLKAKRPDLANVLAGGPVRNGMTDEQRKQVVGTLVKAGRRDLAFKFVLAGGGHHHKDGKDYYADTAFMNSIRSAWPQAEMVHMGFGEFKLKVPGGGEIEFDRLRGKDFPGQSGRSHKLYDNQNGKAVQELIKRMEKAKASEPV